MAAPHSWLEPDNWTKNPMPREALEARIERILTLTNIGYLGTLGKNGPIVSPLEFYADGFDVYVFPQPNSPKVKAMQRNPSICLAVANPMAGWACAMGCQMFGNAELLALQVDADSREAIQAREIRASANRATALVRQILTFARGVEGERAQIDVRPIIRDIMHLAQETFHKGIECVADGAHAPCLITGDHTQLHQVLLNLCVNARDAMPAAGRLTLSAREVQVDDFTASAHGGKSGPHILIEVADTGAGMPPEVIERIFDPFFTTKEVGKGTGLGLSTVHSIVKSHGGMLGVRSQPGAGTTFSIYLPADAASKAPATEDTTHSLPHGNGELLLVIDDEQAVRTITQQTLEVFGYRVLLAVDGAQALSLYAERRSEVAAVITDLMMPVMSGEATIEVLRRLNPDVKIIAGTGVATTDVTERLARLGVTHILSKPYTTETMLKALRQVLA